MTSIVQEEKNVFTRGQHAKTHQLFPGDSLMHVYLGDLLSLLLQTTITKDSVN